MRTTIANSLSYLGAGIGLALFAIFGLLYGSFIGGVLGLNIAGAIFGTPVTQGVFPRVIVAIGMLTGVLVAGTIFVMGAAVVGWLIGYVIDPLTWSKKKYLPEHEVNH